MRSFIAALTRIAGQVWHWFRGLTRRAQIIVGSVALVGMCACCGIAGAAGNTSTANQQASNNRSSSSTVATAKPGATATHVITGTPKPQATATHAPVPTQPAPTQPVSHPPTATPKPAPKYPAINSNPYDYTLVNTGHLLYNPATDICNWLNCIASFWKSTNGYVDLCNDGTYSHSGGVQGACSRHGYEKQPVYQP